MKLRTKVLISRSVGVACGAVGILLLLTGDPVAIVIAVPDMGCAVLWGFVFPRRLIREAREKERLEAKREGEAETSGKHTQEQERPEPE
jgi:hypothetical protein